MQVYLVQPPYLGIASDVQPPLGLLLLGAILEAEGHEPHVVDLNLFVKAGDFDPQRSFRTQFLRRLPRRSKEIDLIGITTWSYNFGITMEFVEEVKRKHPQVPIVLGGPHVTFVDTQVLEQFPSVDYVLRDEGDRTFPQLLRALEYADPPQKLALIPGLTWRRGGEVVRNPSGGVIEDLDALPLPAYHLVEPRDYLACNPVIPLEAGRGCPYNCNFCSTTNMFQRKYRVKSAPRLVDEIAWGIEHLGTNRFELLHDNLVAKKSYVLELCQEIRERNLDVEWSCTSRTDNLTEELAEAMFLAGCTSIFFGIESLSVERQAWTGKKLKPAKIHEAVEVTARQHIKPSTGIIIGFPEETDEELNETLLAAARWRAHPAIRGDVSTASLRFYPGADLFKHKDELRYDERASADVDPIPGHTLREAWRSEVELFPLDSIHTSPEETRRTLVRRNVLRVLFGVCSRTFYALLLHGEHTPREVLDAIQEHGGEALLDPDRITRNNATLLALGELIEDADPELRELFSCEVPFWRSEPVVAQLDHIEHVVVPKYFEHASLLAWAAGERAERPERLDTHSILAVRHGPESVVWFTEDPEALWEQFQTQFASDPLGTARWLDSLTPR
ncbi:MAG: radical SAM protein [Planctomycetota bacterium]